MAARTFGALHQPQTSVRWARQNILLLRWGRAEAYGVVCVHAHPFGLAQGRGKLFAHGTREEWSTQFFFGVGKKTERFGGWKSDSAE
ncbi:MAG: hypothetical protein WCC32_11655 [Terriglobales bacterium]